MKNIIIRVCLLLLLPSMAWAQVDRSQKPQPGPAPEIRIPEAQQFTLANGLKVYVVENHKIPRVSFSLQLDIDPILEKGKAGYVRMAGQLMRRGTKTRSKSQIDESIDFVGASLSTSSGGVFGSSLKKHTNTLLELMADVVLNPTFPQEELDKVKKETLSNLQAGKDDPDNISSNLQLALRYGKDHPFGELETEKTVEAITREDCEQFYQTYFKPNVAYLAVVGDITLEEAKPMIEKYLGAWAQGEVPSQDYEMPKAPAKPQVALANKAGAVQTVLALTYPIDLTIGDPDYIRTRVLNEIFGGGSFGARLFQNLREDKGYTYGAYASINQSQLVGSFYAGAKVRTEVTDSSVTQFLYEMNRIRTTLVTDEELKRAKSKLTGSFARGLESPQRIAQFALNTAIYNLPKNYYQNYLTTLNGVTRQNVLDVAKKYILPENAYIVAVGDVNAIEDKLKAFGEVRKYDNYGNPEGQADQSLLEGMTAEKVIAKYLEAIGGKAKIDQIKSYQAQGNTQIQGQEAEFVVLKKDLKKSLSTLKITAFGVEIKTIYNEGKGIQSSPQGKQNVEGKELESLSYGSAIVLENSYETFGLKAELKQLQMYEGKPAYEVVFTSESGNTSVRWYDAASGLLVKEVRDQQSSEYLNYQEVSGVKFPNKIKLGTPAGALEINFTNISANPALDESNFVIE